ncbi:hypothetical protein [Halorubrum ezzemoulense]|uniref:DUF4935 domain-containing protein n=1 Tax=Halorubrum ezzemoulense TaxID=337243 RepID=A0A256IV22_HALEZ|nr:hypothetical protein [Halorubrum ezzemoulense]OYR59957.1 hypothetical protein DJ80_16655 [Halorubrum ezzemoulense]
MSSEPSEAREEVFCDTCVLISYILDQQNEGARKLLLESEFDKAISEKVEEEFQRVPDRKDEIYHDFIEVIISDEDDIAEQKADERDYLKYNDIGFFNQLRDDIQQGESQKEQMRILREKQKVADRRYGRVQEIVGEPYPRNDDIGLLLGIGQEVSNEDDCQVVCDAVSWNLNGGSGKFATLDKKDLLSNERDINRAIGEKKGSEGTLDISLPKAYVAT